MKLVVGLGNPGKQYERTRHNIGWSVLAKLAKQQQADPPRSKFEGEVSECRLGNERSLLLAPHTFMNLSGRSVGAAVDFFKLKNEDILVVCDDFHLPLGTLRLRPRGTHGGQKGLADIIGRLGTDEFARLRVGIGPVPDRWNPADFVLGKFANKESEEVEYQVVRACDAIVVWATEGITQAMNQYNGSPPS